MDEIWLSTHRERRRHGEEEEGNGSHAGPVHRPKPSQGTLLPTDSEPAWLILGAGLEETVESGERQPSVLRSSVLRLALQRIAAPRPRRIRPQRSSPPWLRAPPTGGRTIPAVMPRRPRACAPAFSRAAALCGPGSKGTIDENLPCAFPSGASARLPGTRRSYEGADVLRRARAGKARRSRLRGQTWQSGVTPGGR